jgi:hypothetical protein
MIVKPGLSIAAIIVLAAAAAVSGCDLLGSSGQKTYGTPEQAVEALTAAVKSGESRALLRVLGEQAKPLIESGDEVQDANGRRALASQYEAHHRIQSETPERALLLVGEDDWAFPFPLVKETAGWRFDTSQGVEEIVDRRVGANELYTIQACLAYVDAQSEYYRRNPEQDSILHYARSLISTGDKRDGLYWEPGADEEASPLGAEFARARDEGYLADSAHRPDPFHGYYYRVLESQGPNAPGGAYDYLTHDRLIGGFALLAYPAEYGSSGVMTFIVSHDGAVFSKDLGAETATLAPQITAFDPDQSWKRELSE